jgi:transposase-like protein
VRSLVQSFAEALMSAEASGLCQAEYGKVSGERVNSRNGYRNRRWDTRAGTIDLAIPKLRSGSYFPDWLIEPRRRVERALVAVVAQCYVEGVSTRRVDDVVKSMGITGISKSQFPSWPNRWTRQWLPSAIGPSMPGPTPTSGWTL